MGHQWDISWTPVVLGPQLQTHLQVQVLQVLLQLQVGVVGLQGDRDNQKQTVNRQGRSACSLTSAHMTGSRFTNQKTGLSDTPAAAEALSMRGKQRTDHMTRWTKPQQDGRCWLEAATGSP